MRFKLIDNGKEEGQASAKTQHAQRPWDRRKCDVKEAVTGPVWTSEKVRGSWVQAEARKVGCYLYICSISIIITLVKNVESQTRPQTYCIRICIYEDSQVVSRHKA